MVPAGDMIRIAADWKGETPLYTLAEAEQITGLEPIGEFDVNLCIVVVVVGNKVCEEIF